MKDLKKMNELQKNISYYDSYSQNYDLNREHPYYDFLVKEELNILIPHIKNKKVLEVGCGTGVFMDLIKNDCDVVGIDVSSGMLEKARQKSLVVKEGNAESLPFSPESFDVVYSFKTMPHVVNINESLDEINRVLKKNGVALIEFYNRHSIKYWLNKIEHVFFPKKFFIRYDSISKVIMECKKSGFIIKNYYGIRFVLPHKFFYNFGFCRWIEKKVRNVLKPFGSFMIFEVQKEW